MKQNVCPSRDFGPCHFSPNFCAFCGTKKIVDLGDPWRGKATINPNLVGAAIVDYYTSGMSRHQRLGQYLINTHMTGNTIWPSLFYEETASVAIEMFTDHLTKTATRVIISSPKQGHDDD